MGKHVTVHVDGVVQLASDVTARQIVLVYRLGDRLRAAAARLRVATMKAERKR